MLTLFPDIKNDIANSEGLVLMYFIKKLSEKYNSILYMLVSKTSKQILPYTINPLKITNKSLAKVNYE
jgi:hypothetical protein